MYLLKYAKLPASRNASRDLIIGTPKQRCLPSHSSHIFVCICPTLALPISKVTQELLFCPLIQYVQVSVERTLSSEPLLTLTKPGGTTISLAFCAMSVCVRA